MSAILVIALPFVALMWLILRDANQRKMPKHVSPTSRIRLWISRFCGFLRAVSI